jgi:signal transduction histidine kinase
MAAGHARNDGRRTRLHAVARGPESGVQLGTPRKGTALYGQGQGAANSVNTMDITVGTTVDRQDPAPGRRRPVPWSPRMWSQALYLAGGIPAQLIAALILAGAGGWSDLILRGSSGWHASRSNILLWLACVVLTFALIPVLTRVHRHRLRACAGVEIPPQPERAPLTWQGLAEVVRSQATWRQLSYHVLIAPLLAAAAVVAVGLWPASVTCVIASAVGLADSSVSGKHGAVSLGLMFAGAIGLFAAPWFTAGVRALDIRAARTLLGPSRTDELEHRVEQLTETRAGVVDAADAERRRLERDLHDGTQQRLVSLAINLGMARAQAGTAEEAKQAIAEAHEEAKAALAELRDLIRGLHPAVLEDRGLDAALSGIAARMPVPVRLTVDLPRRPAPVIEAVAYFVVSEGLANIAKHSQATEAAVFVQRAGDRLHVIVTDDGVGGASPARGTGLAGLARRAASVDGTFDIDSPPGGPTLLTVDLPCNR